MRRASLLVLALGLAGCDTPSAGFVGTEPVPVRIGPSSFDIRVKGDRAEAIRTNTEVGSTFASIAPRAALAMEQASGCKVVPTTVEGDASMVRATLGCPPVRKAGP
ncbi:hypothetical protein [Rubellimicrobium aerolatum]|uniref:Succinate dehydrogenase n=1 Tax=Rubellimicrobium aerolatum TaxID=490979 RepID=A0ABW0SCW5_9RHOB|nr:hypothetical protein [Rubellimicrobium aerolatum]MBP1806143.1 hypothetical protein [Rubellimicrobium aerolatum]